MTGLNSNIVKGGALLDDTTQFLASWDPCTRGQDALDRVVSDNTLGLPTRSRAADIARYVLGPRLVNPGEQVMLGLRELRHDRESFVDACYYEATRADDLLSHFAEDAVWNWYAEGRLDVDVELTQEWLQRLADHGDIPSWSDSLSKRVARGLTATLRDFGRLSGARKSRRKEVARPGISIGGFVYVSYRLHAQGTPSRGILTSKVWRRWLLDEHRVDELMHRLASMGIVFYSVAGSSLRIDWRVDSLEEAIRAVV